VTDDGRARPPARRSLGNGPKCVAVSYDGTHYIFVGGMWDSGIWPYIEP